MFQIDLFLKSQGLNIIEVHEVIVSHGDELLLVPSHEVQSRDLELVMDFYLLEVVYHLINIKWLTITPYKQLFIIIRSLLSAIC